MGSAEREEKNIDGPFHQAGASGSGEMADVDKPSPFKFRAYSSHIPEDRITAVLLVPFYEGSIVAVEHYKRGIDIPGGHKENVDRSNYETARRELLEEAGVEIGQMIPCLIMESSGYDGDDTEPSYMIVMTGVAHKIGRFTPSKEIIARHFLSPEVFLQSYGGPYEKDMAFIIQTSLETIRDKHGAAPEGFGWN